MTLLTQIRTGAYYDSIVLMQLQRGLASLPNVEAVGVVMGTPANKDLLQQSALLDDSGRRANADDLLIAIQAIDADSARSAMEQVDALLQRKSGGDGLEQRPRTLDSATRLLPEAGWVLISTPGRFAAAVAREALGLGRSVFLYSDNVALEDEVSLKLQAAQSGLLLMGPDCGTAIVNGIGLGFANRVRRGPIGVIGASGTGLQQVTARIDQLGSGITHALGTGGRDLSDSVGAVTARQALSLLRRDTNTRVIVLVSKPPSPAVAELLLREARACAKPVVVDFIGYPTAESQIENVYFVKTLDEAAELAVELAEFDEVPPSPPSDTIGFLRGLYSGGTLAYEAQLLLRDHLPEVWSNAPLDKRFRLPQATESRCHTIVDLGDDELTVGRLHPMLDNELRIRRILHEAADPEAGAILLDVVLGDGAHPDPASELGPAIERAIQIASDAGRSLAVVAVVVGTESDPQGLQAQVERLEHSGAEVHLRHEEAVRSAARRVSAHAPELAPVDLALLSAPMAAINVGLESFRESLLAQGAPVVQLDWRPPARGDERLMGILARMKVKGQSPQVEEESP
jgi:FdrA protein